MQTHSSTRQKTLQTKNTRKWRYLVWTVVFFAFHSAYSYRYPWYVFFSLLVYRQAKYASVDFFSSLHVCIFQRATKMDENMMNKQIQLIQIEYKIITIRKIDAIETVQRCGITCYICTQQSPEFRAHCIGSLQRIKKWNETDANNKNRIVVSLYHFLGLFFPVVAVAFSVYLRPVYQPVLLAFFLGIICSIARLYDERNRLGRMWKSNQSFRQYGQCVAREYHQHAHTLAEIIL